jgi:hypothetical protein
MQRGAKRLYDVSVVSRSGLALVSASEHSIKG